MTIEHKLRILSLCSVQANGGVYAIRQFAPLEELKKQGLIEVEHYGYNEGQKHVDPPNEEYFAKYKDWADIVYSSREDTPQYTAMLGGVAKWYGVPAMVDYDDNVHAVRPWNPGYASFHPNSPHKIWNIKLVQEAKFLTVSTNNLKKIYSKYCNNIYLCENSIDFEIRDKILDTPPEVPKKDNEIRIGWAGSSAHWENLKIIEKDVYKILDKYPQTTFHYTGLFGDLFKDAKYGDRIQPVKFADIGDWPKKLKAMGLDIALAPLADNEFNRAKSNLRILEYAACKFPTIASPVEPYRDYIKPNNGDIAILCNNDEWFDKISFLIDNPQRRVLIGELGYKYCKENYNIKQKSLMWFDAFKTAIKKYKRSL